MIADWARHQGHSLSSTQLYAGEELPGTEEFDFLVVMGGPMSVKDEAALAWLRPEKRLVGEAMAAGKPVLGVCLGAQMIADVLGARVYRNRVKEVGWAAVQRTAEAAESAVFRDFPEDLNVFHWHGETFDLPAGATLLASTLACRNQAFSYGSALALQFHLEMTEEIIEPLMEACAEDLNSGPYAQSMEEIRAGLWRAETIRPVLYGLLDRLSAHVPSE